MECPDNSDLFQLDAPLPLVEICLNRCVTDLHTFCKCHHRTSDAGRAYRLSGATALPTEICERLLRTFLYRRRCYRNLDESQRDFAPLSEFLLIFGDATQTPLQRANFAATELDDADMAVVARHPLVELNVGGCARLTPAALPFIRDLRQLQVLRLGDSAEKLFPCRDGGGGGKTRGRQEEDEGLALRSTSLRMLTLQRLACPDAASLLARTLLPLRQLVYLELAQCSNLGDLSYTLHLQSLRFLVLPMHDARELPNIVDSICQLKALRHLDISQSEEQVTMNFQKADALLKRIVDSLPKLVSLDISCTELAGLEESESTEMVYHKPMPNDPEDSNLTSRPTEACINSDIIALRGLQRPLEFLGLLNCVNDPCHRANIPALTVAGDANEQQVLTAVEHYMERTAQLVHALNDLFHLFRTTPVHNTRKSLQLVLLAMEKHHADKLVQISGSASLFYIMKSEEKQKFTAKVNRRIITALLNGMEKFLEQGSVSGIGVLRIYFASCRCDEDLHAPYYCVEGRLPLQKHGVRRTVRDRWSTMWNVTDETPDNCRKFLENRGMEFFTSCLLAFEEKDELLRNMLGLLGNVAEVIELRCHIMTEEYISWFKYVRLHLFAYEKLVEILLRTVQRDDDEDFIQRISIYLLNSLACQVDNRQRNLIGVKGGIEVDNRQCNLIGVKGGIEIMLKLVEGRLHNNTCDDVMEIAWSTMWNVTGQVYNAAGILAHIASDGRDAWTIAAPPRHEVLARMADTIERWSLTKHRNINYRSFKPILRLLVHYDTPQVQHWAVWALANLTKVYSSRYCELLKEEGGLAMLREIVDDPRPYARIRQLADMVLDNYHSFVDEQTHAADADAL
ncbi:PREDICTED: protein zer-1 homolog [Priapulus caudatus]|uniref:Protein zer-1 homolog n=1 Tax=Priapulus caudatus TaxID=37621 RepID=A0ABM1ECD8_PRICU|nr:PREDICTED: protein zer-1 homolog [Priapulus caudatus]